MRTVVGTLLAMAVLSLSAHASDDFSRPVKASPDGHFLSQPDGTPFFWMEELALGLFIDLTKDEADAYLRDRAAKGYNVVRVAAIGDDVTGINAANPDGNRAFFNDDYRKPDEKYWRHVDWVVARAQRYGLRIAMVPTWGLMTVNAPGSKVHFDEEGAAFYGKWIARRYPQAVLWVLGGDATPIWNSNWLDAAKPVKLEDFRPVYDAMASAIIDVQGNDAFITYSISCCSWKGTAEPRTSLYYGDRAWLDMNNLQSGPFIDTRSFLQATHLEFGWDSTLSYEPICAEYDSAPTRPVIDGDNAAEDSPVGFDLKERRYAAYDLRLRAYHSVFSGAAGATYVNHNVGWHFNDPVHDTAFERGLLEGLGIRAPWRTQLDAEGSAQLPKIKALMLSRPYFTRIPDQSLIVGNIGQGSARLSATRDKSGSYLMIYLPEGRSVTVDMNKLTGAVAVAWWFDPRTGKAAKIEGGL